MAPSVLAQRQDLLSCQAATVDVPPFPAATSHASNLVLGQANSGPSEASKRHKRYAPKVRTGCLTCKKRRVKCDETKPKCLKCLNSDYQCNGYAPPKAWVFESSMKGTPPKEETISLSTTSEDEEKAPSLLVHPAAHPFTPDEARSMLFYLRRSGRIISKYDHSRFQFWMEMLPKAAHRFESVKHILVATALQDELFTSPTTIARIERRITYHYQQALQKTIYAKPTVDHILLNCMSMYYFDSLRDDLKLVVLHTESARRIIDEWRSKDEKAPAELCELIDAIDGIVTDASSYNQICPSPPVEPGVDWSKVPAADPYDSAEDAEHALIACMGNLCRMAGQVPLALVRANVFLSSWSCDSRDAIKRADADTTINLAALFQIAKDLIRLHDKSSPDSQDKRWTRLLTSMQEMPKLRSVKYRKPVTAIMNVLQQTSETKKQADAIKVLHNHLQRGIVYDG